MDRVNTASCRGYSDEAMETDFNLLIDATMEEAPDLWDIAYRMRERYPFLFVDPKSIDGKAHPLNNIAACLRIAIEDVLASFEDNEGKDASGESMAFSGDF